MTKLLISAFCLLHWVAIFWWALPDNFGGLAFATSEQESFQARPSKWIMLSDFPKITSLLQKYIDITGGQQYWDFFAPRSPKFHQYLSVCNGITALPEQGELSCKSQALFTNLDESFKRFGSDRSRLYRLTENLAYLEEPIYLNAFTQYYQAYDSGKLYVHVPVQLVLHQFELHPELKDLPKIGYRMDKVIWVSR